MQTFVLVEEPFGAGVGKMKMATAIPAQKVTAAVVAVAASQIGIYTFETLSAHDLPAAIEMAVNTIAVGLAGYFTPPAERDEVVNNQVPQNLMENTDE